MEKENNNILEEVSEHTNNYNTGISHKKIILIFFVCFFIIFAGLYLFIKTYFTSEKISQKTENLQNNISNILNSENKVEEKITFLDDNKDWFEQKIEYPKGNQVVKEKIFENYKNFTDDTKVLDFKNPEEAQRELSINSDYKYSFIATYETANSKDRGKNKTTSYIYTIYTFTGGAHGATNALAITLDENGKEINLENILPAASLEKVSKIVYDEILRQKTQKLSEGMTKKEFSEYINNPENTEWIKEGTSPKRENYSTVWADGDDLVIYFGQYQVGSYAEGDYIVRIPKSEILK